MYAKVAGSLYSTVTNASQQISAAMSGKNLYSFVSSTACWIAQGANPTAAKSAGSMFVPAGVPVLLIGSAGAKLAVLRDAADGGCSITPVGFRASP